MPVSETTRKSRTIVDHILHAAELDVTQAVNSCTPDTHYNSLLYHAARWQLLHKSVLLKRMKLKYLAWTYEHQSIFTEMLTAH